MIRWRDPPEHTRDTQDSNGGNLDEVSNSGERELVESTFSRHKVEQWCCHPTVKNSDPQLFPCKRTSGKKWRRD